MNFVDVASLAGMGFGYVRGRKSGLARELYRLINIGIVFVAGCSLYKLVGKVIGLIPGLDPEGSGALGFVAVVVASFVIMRKVRGTLRTFLEARFGQNANPNVAGLVGLARWALAIVGVIIALVLSGAPIVSEAVAEGSWLGRLVGAVVR